MTSSDSALIPSTALCGVRVLDASRILAGPWSTQILGDLGADVIKIEHPKHGDDTRSWGPPFLSKSGNKTGESAYYLAANRNKRSLTCDISTAAGQDIVRRLAEQSQIFVENFKVGDMARYGLDYEALSRINPKLVYCSITGFGQSGPHAHKAGYDYAIQAMGGLMSVTGESDALGGGPQKVGVAVADLFTGMYATVAILAALRHAENTGQGQYIDMALLDAQIAMLANLSSNYLVGGKVPIRMGNAHPNIVPYQVFATAPSATGQKEYMVLAVGNDKQFSKFCQAVGLGALAADPRYATNAQRVAERETLVPLIQAHLLSAGKQHWLDLLEKVQVPCSAINHIGETWADPHIAARGLLEHWEHPQHDKLPLAASPLHLSATPVRKSHSGGTAPPTLGQHSTEILQQLLGLDTQAIAALRAAGVV